MAPFLLSLGFESGSLPPQTRWSWGATGAGPLCVLVSRFLTCLPPLPPQVFFIESVCDDPTVVASNIMVRPRWTPGQFLGPEGGPALLPAVGFVQGGTQVAGRAGQCFT